MKNFKIFALTLWLMLKDLTPWALCVIYVVASVVAHIWIWDLNPFGGFIFMLGQTLALFIASGLYLWFRERWAHASARFEDDDDGEL